MTTVTVSMPDLLKEFLDQEVETKGYGNVSEYIRSLLREAQARSADARLEALLLEGLAGGRDIPVTPNFWRQLKSEAAQILTSQRKASKRRAKK